MRVTILQVCRALYNACSSEKLWKRLYNKHFMRNSPGIHSVAEDVGWKKAFMVHQLKLQAVRVRKRVQDMKQQEELNSTTSEDRKKLTLVM